MTDIDTLREKQEEIRKKQLELMAEVFNTPITFRRRFLNCPMCLKKMQILDPNNHYECPNCKASFDMTNYGDEYEGELKKEVEKGLTPDELKNLEEVIERHKETLKKLAE